MILAYLLLLTGLTISAVAIYYSVVGLTAIFSAAAIPIMIMGVSLEVAKLVCATWIKQYWTQVPRLMKTYMVVAVTVLMLITSMGIFGFLSKAHNDQNLVSGDVQSKIAIYDEKIKTARDNIEADRKSLKQMDEAVDQVMGRSSDEKGADKAVAIRRSQAKDRAALAKDIEANQKIISTLNDEAAPIRAEVRKVDAEVGPIKYIAAFLYGTAPDAGMLERAVTWIIIMIVVVFDPLAVIMLLASQMTFGWQRKELEPKPTASINDFVAQPQEYIPDEESDKEDDLRIDRELEELKRELELPAEDVDRINELATEAKEEPELEYFIIEDADEEDLVDEYPFRGKGSLPSIPMTASYQQPVVNEPEPVALEPEPVVEVVPFTNTMDERPGYYVEQPVDIPNPRASEAAPAFGRGVINTHLLAEADNAPALEQQARSDFGNLFPINPNKGDTYLRTDYLPNRLFKFNGQKWIQVDKNSTDVYAYEDRYIQHLIEELDAGRYDADMLTDLEQQQIKNYLERNA